MTNISVLFARRVALAAALAVSVVVCGCGTKDGSKEIAAGEAAYAARNFEKAERLFGKALGRVPESADALLWMARTKLALGDLEQAGDFAARAASVSDGADIALVSAQVAFHRKDYAEAVRGFRSVADDARLPAEVRAQAWSGIGTVEYARENSHLARIAFLRARRLNFKDAAARYHLGLLYRDAFGYYEAALEQFKSFVQLEPEATPRVQRVQRSFIPELQKKIQSIAASRPGAAGRDSAAAARALVRAAAAAKAGRNDAARREYEAALKSDPLSAPAALGLAGCWAKTPPSKRKGGEANPQSRALDNYQLACSLAPSKVSTFLTAGALALKLNHSARAAEIYSRAVAANPTSLEALDGLIRALRRQGKPKVAQEYQLYRESLHDKPTARSGSGAVSK